MFQNVFLKYYQHGFMKSRKIFFQLNFSHVLRRNKTLSSLDKHLYTNNLIQHLNANKFIFVEAIVHEINLIPLKTVVER